MANEYIGVTARANSIQIAFTYKGERCRETLKIPPTATNLKSAHRKRQAVLHAIEMGNFDYAEHFPRSRHAIRLSNRKGHHITIAEALNAWLKNAEKYCQRSTIRGYSSAVYYYLIPQFGALALESLERADVIRWLDSLSVSNKRKNNTLIPLRRIFDEAFLEGTIRDDPIKRIRNLPVRNREPKPFNLNEIELILEQLCGSDKNMIQFAFWSGVRTSELIALKWSHVDLRAKKAHVCEAIVEGKQKGTKTQSGTRILELMDLAIEALRKQQKISGDMEFVFIDPKHGGRWKSDQFIRKRVWIPALKRAGIEYRNPYQTRHTYASMMFSQGKNIGWLQQQMGHKDWGMLSKVYARWLPTS